MFKWLQEFFNVDILYSNGLWKCKSVSVFCLWLPHLRLILMPDVTWAIVYYMIWCFKVTCLTLQTDTADLCLSLLFSVDLSTQNGQNFQDFDCQVRVIIRPSCTPYGLLKHSATVINLLLLHYCFISQHGVMVKDSWPVLHCRAVKFTLVSLCFSVGVWECLWVVSWASVCYPLKNRIWLRILAHFIIICLFHYYCSSLHSFFFLICSSGNHLVIQYTQNISYKNAVTIFRF